MIRGPNLRDKMNEVPTCPGIYKYCDITGKVIYVGKAKNLRNRVRSYFSIPFEETSKTALLVKQIETIEYIETLSELEALILEAALIKKYKPKYNIALKDDKSYLYIVIRPEKMEKNGKLVTLPVVLSARQTDLKKGDIYFGPYPHAHYAKSVLRIMRTVLPYRDCSRSKFNHHAHKNVPCLYGHIGLCQAPCTDRISSLSYQRDIKKVKDLLSGESNKFVRSLETEMKAFSRVHDYENAAKNRDILKKFDYIRQKFSRADDYMQNPYLAEDLREKSLAELQASIPFLNSPPERIECYDISNVSGTDSVGSMVVAINGEITKREYRKFKIKTKNTPDDFAMMAEVLYRRLKKDWDAPDLIVLDGGKGQLSAVLGVFAKLNIEYPLIGLAKKNETIVCFNEGEFYEINLPRDNEGLKLLQRLRDEAHRFAQAYHHKLRLDRVKENLTSK